MKRGNFQSAKFYALNNIFSYVDFTLFHCKDDFLKKIFVTWFNPKKCAIISKSDNRFFLRLVRQYNELYRELFRRKELL